jgi:hypothetical protein
MLDSTGSVVRVGMLAAHGGQTLLEVLPRDREFHARLRFDPGPGSAGFHTHLYVVPL